MHGRLLDIKLTYHALIGDERFEEATAYIEMHQLYEVALKIWKDTGRYETILDLYGDWLYERRDFRQAAVGAYLSPFLFFFKSCQR